MVNVYGCVLDAKPVEALACNSGYLYGVAEICPDPPLVHMRA
jgi:hypothetical protein